MSAGPPRPWTPIRPPTRRPGSWGRNPGGTEVAQLAGDFHRRTSYRPTLPKYQTLEEAAYLMAPGPLKPLNSLPNLSHPNLKEEIGHCLAALSRLNLEVLVVDVTHPGVKIPAVYV